MLHESNSNETHWVQTKRTWKWGVSSGRRVHSRNWREPDRVMINESDQNAQYTYIKLSKNKQKIKIRNKWKGRENGRKQKGRKEWRLEGLVFSDWGARSSKHRFALVLRTVLILEPWTLRPFIREKHCSLGVILPDSHSEGAVSAQQEAATATVSTSWASATFHPHTLLGLLHCP